MKDGEITLAGFVRTGSERKAAEMTVAELTGVRRVRNNIQIRDLKTVLSDLGPGGPRAVRSRDR